MNPELIREFQWEAQRLFKFNGQLFERFIDEPWTANLWWNTQVTIIFTHNPVY